MIRPHDPAERSWWRKRGLRRSGCADWERVLFMVRNAGRGSLRGMIRKFSDVMAGAVSDG